MNDPVHESGDALPESAGDLRSAVTGRLARSAGWLRDLSLDPAWVVHEVRKDLKLSALRDADALLETLDRLALRAAGDEQARAVAAARERLAGERGAFGGKEGLPGSVAGPVADALEEAAADLGGMSFDAVDDRVLDRGLERSRARAVRAWRRVSASPAPERMHELRKAVKRELYQRELSGRPFDRMDRAMLKTLSDVLGEIQDLEVLRSALKADGAWRDPLRGLAKQTRRELEQRAARLAGARYGEARG
jgi:CHAD domain-containing protein